MKLKSADSKRIVNIGGVDIWHSVYSTIEKRFGIAKRKVPYAINFLKTCECSPENALECARQFNLIRDELSKYPPSKAVYDINDSTKTAPWENNLSPVITSCANMYTTADGKDLLFEVVSILTYAHYAKVSVSAS